MVINNKNKTAVRLPDGSGIYQKLKRKHGALTAIQLTREGLEKFYSSEAAKKVPAKKVFKKYDKLTYSVRQESIDVKGIFMALVAGSVISKFINDIVDMLSTQLVSTAQITDMNRRAIITLAGVGVFLLVIVIVAVPLGMWISFTLNRFNRNEYINYILPIETSLLKNLLEGEHCLKIQAEQMVKKITVIRCKKCSRGMSIGSKASTPKR